MNRLLLRLLRRHISPLQLLGFSLANFVGVAIILLGIQFYQDARSSLEAKDKFMKGDYIILSKRVGGLALFASEDNTFSDREIKELEGQSFVKKVGRFTPSKFQVSAGLGVGSGVYTYMFFESVPDDFIDVSSDEWQYRDGDTSVPIIIPRNYLGLYNSAFAQSQGLPLLSEATMSKIPLTIEAIGQHETLQLRGRIVGFSNRLNTLLVPHSFLSSMNARLAPNEMVRPTRLIVEVTSVSDPEIPVYLKANGYESEGERLASGESMYLLRLVAGIVLSVGLLISVLSVYLLMLSIYLLLQKNTKQLESLLLLGYTRQELVRPYLALTFLLNALVIIVSLVAVIEVRGYYLRLAERLLSDEIGGTMRYTYLAAAALLCVTTLLNGLAIRRKIYSLRTFS